MRFSLFFGLVAFLLLSTSPTSDAQFFRALQNFFRPINNFFSGMVRPFFGPRFHDDGTQRPQSTGRDELFPTDCGRDPDKGTGKLCFPDGLLCQRSKSFKKIFVIGLFFMIFKGWTALSSCFIYFIGLKNFFKGCKTKK